MWTTEFRLDGLTCDQCVAEVLQRMRELDGVTGVGVAVSGPGSSSVLVTSAGPLARTHVRERMSGAGFTLGGPWTADVTEDDHERVLDDNHERVLVEHLAAHPSHARTGVAHRRADPGGPSA